ncbi:uncharacterized protein LOC110068219 [Orbicella faveolata]|uniref:uncharacterized protein LOC110068219 n=1 Tax=Orbicella faveolata TaxID=48498 RepID=UPI0009E2FF8D|nr:uncharacterized protein LOC110068219 [Orbicella faveolata]
MVCSKVDSSDQISIMDGDTGNKADENAFRSRAIDILTPEGETFKISAGDNAMIKDIKIDCELLCGIPSDLQLIRLQNKDLCNEDTVANLGITDGCTLRVTVPQWWQKFVSTCYKGDTQQVRKRIYVKMSQVSREERSFTAAFIGAVKGNHNLMFAAFAGGKMNLHSKTKLSGRNLLHAAVSGGSTSCVANILMNEGNALLEAPDNTGETPVKMAIKLYGETGDIVKFLNVYLELHRRDAKHSGFSNHYWDNLEQNNINISDAVSGDGDSNDGDDSNSQSDENISNKIGDLDLDSDEPPGEKIRMNYTQTDFFTHNSGESLPSVTKVNIEDYDATKGQDSLAVSLDSSSKLDEPQINANPNSLSSFEQGCGQKSDTGYYSSNNQSTGKDANHVTEMLWNESLFTQGKTPPIETTTNQASNLAADEPEDVKNASVLSADPSADDDADSSHWPKPPRRAQLRKQSIIDSRRKKSTTERPNLELLLAMRSENSSPLQGQNSEGIVSEQRDSEVLTNESHDNEQSREGFTNESREKQVSATNVEDQKDQATLPTASPKPLRRAQLRKKSIVEQRRRRSIASRPNLDELAANREEEAEEATSAEPKPESSVLEPKEQGTTAVESKEEGTTAPEIKEKGSAAVESKEKESSGVESKETESTAVHFKEEESPISARYVLQLWQDQAQEFAAAALSGDESDTSHSPKIPRRAFLRKQVFVEQRRRRSATERPNLIRLMAPAKEQGDGEEPGEEAAEITCPDKGEEKSPVESQNDVCAISVGQESICYDFSPVASSDDVSMKEHYSEDKETPETSWRSPAVVQTQERVPIRTSQRCSNTGPLLEARATRNQRHNRSALSGDESDVSDNEQGVLQETVAPINRVVKTQRRRRLPVLPDKTIKNEIKLPLIKIEDSSSSVNSDSRDAHVANQVRASGPVNGEMRSAAIAPHPPVCRSRSGSICSEDSMSSGEVYSDRPRSQSEEENRYSPQPTPYAKSVPVRQRRKSVPNNTFRPTPNPPITRTRRGSVQVEDLEEKGYQISPQLRARLKLRGQPRENLPWNEWRTRRRSGSIPDGSEEETEAENINHRELSNKDARVDKRVGTHVDTRVAWHEKKGPQSHGNSRMTFTEWLDNKEALERTRPTSPQAARNEQHRDGVGHERHLQTAKKYEEWLQKKDQEALEQEEMLRKRATRKFHRTYKKK